MTAPDIRSIIENVPGRLCYSPTDLSLDFPHGGTALGELALPTVIRSSPIQIITAAEHGNEPVDAVSGGESWVLTATLRQYDRDAYAQVFLNSSIGAVSGHPVIEGGGTNRAGFLYSARAKVFVFSPDDLDNHPMVVFYKAMPMVEDTLDLSLNMEDSFGVPIVLVATRDGSDRVVKIGRRVDLVL